MSAHASSASSSTGVRSLPRRSVTSGPPPPLPAVTSAHSRQVRALQAEIEPNDPIKLALSYALSLKPLLPTETAASAGHSRALTSTLTEQKESTPTLPQLSPTNGRRAASTVASTPDRFSEAMILRPHADKASFITRSSHLNPNARYETRELARASRTGLKRALEEEDEEDRFWREHFFAQTLPGSPTFIRQANNAIRATGVLLDREDGMPVVKEVAGSNEEDQRTHEERITHLVNQLRSAPNHSTTAKKNAAATAGADSEGDFYTYSTNSSLTTSFSPAKLAPVRTFVDERGFVRNIVRKDKDGLPFDPNAITTAADVAGAGDNKSTTTRPLPTRRTARSTTTRGSGLDLTSSGTDHTLLARLARLDYEYEHEVDHAKFLKPKKSSKIHPTWLRARDDFKSYFGTAQERAPEKSTDERAPHSYAAATITSMQHSASAPNIRTKTHSAAVDAALAAAHAAAASSAAVDALTSSVASTTRGVTGPHVSSDVASSVSHASPPTALDLLALHAAEKPPHDRSEKDCANIVRMLSGIEYFARLPASVRAGLASTAQLHRASRGELLFTRLHGTKFMFVYSGAVVSSASVTGDEFAEVALSTEQVKRNIIEERAKKLRKEQRRAEREAEIRKHTERLARLHQEAEQHEVAVAQEKAAAEQAAAAAAASAKEAAATKTNSRILGPSRAAMREREEMGHRHTGWSTAQATEAGAAAPTPSSPLEAASKRTSVSFAPIATPASTPPKTAELAFESSESHQLRAVSTPQRQKHAAARAMLATLEARSGVPDREVRGFQIGTGQPSVWSPSVMRNTVMPPIMTVPATNASPGTQSESNPGYSLRHATALAAVAPPPSTANVPVTESARVHGMVFQRVLNVSSFFGQNDLFENSYAGLDRVVKLKAYQMRLSRLLSDTTNRRQSTGWLKLRTLVHVMITARDKSVIDSVVACAPCVLLTWSHKDLESLITATKEATLNRAITNLNHFRDLLFRSWTYKMLLAFSAQIEVKEFGPGTVLCTQGQMEKPVWDETTRMLRSSKEVFEEACAKANAAAQAEADRRDGIDASLGTAPLAASSTAQVRPALVSSPLNNFGHNPSNYNLYLLTGGMLQLEKSCTLQRSQRWPASRTTWELKSTVVTKKFFGGFLRGKEIIGGEAFLGMEERDFTVSVPAGQTATCIVIKRAVFDQLAQKRIQHAVWSSMVRLRELATGTINARVQLRNHTINHTAHGEKSQVRHTAADATMQVGSQSVNEYLAHILRSQASDPAERQAIVAAITSRQANESTEETSDAIEPTPMPTSRVVAAPPPEKSSLPKLSAGADAKSLADLHKRLDEYLVQQAAETAQLAKEEKVRQKQEKLKAASEQIIADVFEATAGLGEEVVVVDEDTDNYPMLEDATETPIAAPNESARQEAVETSEPPPPQPQPVANEEPDASAPTLTLTFQTPKKTAHVSTPPRTTPSPSQHTPTRHAASLGIHHAHHRSISSYINNLPLRKADSPDTRSTTPAAASRTHSPSPAKRLAASRSAASLHSSPSKVSLSRSKSGAGLLPALLTPLAASLPDLLQTSPSKASSSSGEAAANVYANRALRSFSRTDARDRESAAAKEEVAASRMHARLDAELFERERAAEHRRAFLLGIQKKLAAYELRLRTHQAHKEAVYASKIVEISRRVQANIQSSFHDSPFTSATEAALEAARNSAKLKHLLQEKAERASATASASASATASASASATNERRSANVRGGSPPKTSRVLQLTADELTSLGIPLPSPPLPIEDLSLVSKAIWDKHIRYLTDLEAEQRLVYAEYMTRKRQIEATAAEHDSIRIELLNKRFLKGGLFDVALASSSSSTRDAAAQHRSAAADEEWRLKKEFDALSESMLAMGVAGDEDAEAALSNHVEEMTDPSSLNQNLQENASFTNALLATQAVAPPTPVDHGTSGGHRAAMVAEEQAAQAVFDPALQMELAMTNEPPITDVMEMQAGAKPETHSDIVTDSGAILSGSLVGLYFPPMPPAPDIRTRILHSRPTSPRRPTTLIEEDEDEDSEDDDDDDDDDDEGWVY